VEAAKRAEDRDEWFPRGKWATIQAMQEAIEQELGNLFRPDGVSEGVRTWQHDETGRITQTAECPGPRWTEVPAGVPEGVNPWKDAVLDHLAVCCLDAPQDEPPYKIIGRILDWHVAVATDPAVNGGFKLVPADGVSGKDSETGGAKS
jgi:hypothetical protein